MTKEEIIDGLEICTIGRLKKDRVYITVEELQKYIDAIKTLDQEPCEDCISRFSAKQIIRNHYCSIPSKAFKKLIEELDNLSPVTPIRPKGHWIYDYTSVDGHRTYHCSKCGCYLKPKHSEPLNSFKWCSLCGAEMEEVEE